MPSPPDSAAIGNALIGHLLADTALAALMPDGVYRDVARAGKTRYVIVSLVDSINQATYEGRAIESGLYLVKAVALKNAAAVEAAAARIDQLIEDQFWAIAPGLDLMAAYRVASIGTVTELDAVDPDLRWTHSGARYRLDVAVTYARTLAPLGISRGTDHLERAAS
jgi:hypothetical protein